MIREEQGVLQYRVVTVQPIKNQLQGEITIINVQHPSEVTVEVVRLT